MTLPLELGGVHDPMVRRALEQLSQQFPVVATGGGGGGAPSGPAGGDLGATYPNPTVVKAQSGFTVGGTAVILAGDAALTNSRPPNGAASGDLSGTYPSPQIAAGVIADADINAAAAIAKTKLANLDVVNADVNAAAAIAESKLNLATDAAAGTGSRRTLGTTATSAAAGNRGLPTGGTAGQALTKNSATDYDASWSTVSSGATNGSMTLDTWHTVGAAGEPAFGAGVSNNSGQTLQFRKFPDGKVLLRGFVNCPTAATTLFTLPVGYRPPADHVRFTGIDGTSGGATQLYVSANGTVNKAGASTVVDVSVIEFDTDTATTLFGWTAIPRQAADLTNATTTLANTDLVFTYAANATYVIDLYLMATSTATTTGYAFAFDVSVAVTAVGLTFEHQLATAGTLTGGDSVADGVARSLSSGVPTAATLVPILGKGMLVSGATGGTCRLQFAPEVAASATFKAGSVLRVMRAA